MEYKILDYFAGHLFDRQAMQIDLIVYLRTQPAECLQRIRQRARPEEQLLRLVRLESLSSAEERFLFL